MNIFNRPRVFLIPFIMGAWVVLVTCRSQTFAQNSAAQTTTQTMTDSGRSPTPTLTTSDRKDSATSTTQATPEAHPVIAAAGDIACDPSQISPGNTRKCQMKAVSDLLVDRPLAAVLPLGDLQYADGRLDEFQRSYDPTWGRLNAISRPVPGNHEYHTPGARGYFQYVGDLRQRFPEITGQPEQGYYDYKLGEWHLIALNSNCEEVGGCDAESPQGRWLKQVLSDHASQCTIAYWHHPRFSSGPHGNNANLDDFWRMLYAAGTEVVLNGHDHVYERFAPQTPDGKEEGDRGIRQFVVGTGGKDLYPFQQIKPNSEVRQSDAYGVLELTLRPDGYDWQFRAIASQSFQDAGQGKCH